MTWDFSRVGLKAGIVDFCWSLLKTALVAVVAFVGMKLSNVNVNVDSQTGQIFTGLVLVGRALVSGFNTWVNTLPGDTKG